MKKDFEKEIKEKKTSEKKVYTPPEIGIIWVELEQGIANGSTATRPANNSDVKTEWEGENNMVIETPF
nr:hypothetical protein [Elizabethkingia sp. ASV34]